MEQPEKLLTVTEAAARLTCGRTSIFKMIELGHLRTVRIGAKGRSLRIPEREVTGYIERQLARQGAELRD